MREQAFRAMHGADCATGNAAKTFNKQLACPGNTFNNHLGSAVGAATLREPHMLHCRDGAVRSGSGRIR